VPDLTAGVVVLDTKEDGMSYLRAVVMFLSTTLIYLGFPLLGWGLDDLQGYFSAYQRLGYAAIVAAFGLAVGCQAFGSPEGIRGGKGEKGKLVRRQTIVGAALVYLLFAAMIFMPFADRRGLGAMADSQALGWLGLALCGLGYALVFWSGLALGKQYSAHVTIQKDHQLITTGPYHYIRHPRYLGVNSLAIGVSLVFHSWIGLALSVLVLGLILSRIADEEALLRKEFGQDWETYCKQSWRLIPYLF
jgi:protein-S-isoprenylcysteine O-methyltransferase Ste14